MKYFRVSLVTVKSLNLLFRNETKINTSSVKGSDKREIGTISFKSDIYDSF